MSQLWDKSEGLSVNYHANIRKCTLWGYCILLQYFQAPAELILENQGPTGEGVYKGVGVRVTRWTHANISIILKHKNKILTNNFRVSFFSFERVSIF